MHEPIGNNSDMPSDETSALLTIDGTIMVSAPSTLLGRIGWFFWRCAVKCGLQAEYRVDAIRNNRFSDLPVQVRDAIAAEHLANATRTRPPEA